MSSLTTLARPYARAAFDLAAKAGKLAAWHQSLENAALVVSEPTVNALLDNPALSRAQAVGLVTDTLGDGLDEGMKRFLEVLAENDRLSLLPEVTRLFSVLREQAEQRLTVRVVSAVPLEDDQAKRMSKALAKRFECEIRLQNEVDPRVLGGAVIYAGDQVIDGSLRGRLTRLQNSLV